MSFTHTTSIKNLIRKSPVSERRRKQVVLAVVMVFVALILIADGFLLCRHLDRRQMAILHEQEATNCIELKPLVTGQIVSETMSTVFGFDGKFYHNVLGLSLGYPSDWGRVIIREEYGRTAGGHDVIIGLTLSFSGEMDDGEALFLHATNPNTEPVSRNDHYWGSEGERIKSHEDVLNWCDEQDGCSVFVNDNGLLVARIDSEVQSEDGPSYNRRTYYLYNPVGAYGGVVLSAERLHGSGLEDLEDTFEDIVNSISPLPR